jgi:bifunctional DNA-binding transcriptional regulator/antitoxin component of YhaV-PrlF toxin-antitoxin module
MKGQGNYTIHGDDTRMRVTIPEGVRGSEFDVEPGDEVHITLVEDGDRPHLRLYPEEE